MTTRQVPSFRIHQRLIFNPLIFFYPLPLSAPQTDLLSCNFLCVLLILMYRKVNFPRSTSDFIAGPIYL